MEATKERWHTASALEIAAHDSSGQEKDNSNMEKYISIYK